MNHGLPSEEWDGRLAALDGSILQSRPWGEFQQVLGREVCWAQGNGWQWLAGLRAAQGLRYLICAYGPALGKDAAGVALDSLLAAGRELGVDFIRVEPQTGVKPEQLSEVGGIKIGEANPEHTRVVDLTQDEAELRSALSASHRNRINGTERRGITIRQSDDPADFETFLKMLHDTATHSKVTFWPDSYFRQMREALGSVVGLYMAEAEGEPVASALFYDWGHTRYYAHAGAYQELNRKLKANVSLVWRALLDAKAAGLTQFDLWGVAPEGDTSHRLAGISEFKAGFGGRQVTYLGTWDIPLNRNKYRLYGVYRRLRGRK